RSSSSVGSKSPIQMNPLPRRTHSPTPSRGTACTRQPSSYAVQSSSIRAASSWSAGAVVQAVVEGLGAALLRRGTPDQAVLLALEPLEMCTLLALLLVDLLLAGSDGRFLLARAADAAPRLIVLGVDQAAFAVGETVVHARAARPEAALEAAAERVVTAFGGILHALVPAGPRLLQTSGACRLRAGFAVQHQRRHEDDRRCGEDGQARAHDQDLPIDQSTLVSSLGLIVTFSVFFPSSPCQTSTS